MEFSLTTEQEMFRDTIRNWVERECPKSKALEYEAQEYEYPVSYTHLTLPTTPYV